MQNVLKRKNMYFYEKCAKYIHLGLFYVLDYSGAFDIHYAYRKIKFFFWESAKTLRTVFFIDAFP